MNKKSKTMVELHSYSRKELYDILKDALENLPKSYWKKPSPNSSFDMGFYFNMCRDFIAYKEGINDDEIVSDVIAIRILDKFSKFSKFQLQDKKYKKPPIRCSQVPELNNPLN